MIFDIITIFPEIFEEFKEKGLLGKAQKKGLLDIRIHNLREWADDKHKTVDDKPFGGGLGMVMKIEPILKAVTELKKSDDSKVILFGPSGKKYNQSSAHRFSKIDHLIMICGRYEGVDERVSRYIADEEISIGDYVLMGGDVPAMVVMESVSRLIPGVVGKKEFLKERMEEGTNAALEYPQFTRPAKFQPEDILLPEECDNLTLKGVKVSGTKWNVPEVLLFGDHKEITDWKKSRGRIIR